MALSYLNSSKSLILLTFLISSVHASAQISVEKIMHESDEARGPKTEYSFNAAVTNYNGSDVQSAAYRVSVKGSEFSLIDQTEPARSAGRKLLMRGHDLWLFTPEIKRPTRISFEQRLTGEVANGDVARTRFSEDYKATLSGEESLGGRACYKLHLIANTKEVTYREIDYWVEKKTFYPLKAQFYAISGKLLKTALYSQFKSVLGKMRMTRTEIQDSIQTSKRSILVFSGQKPGKFSDAFFSKESLGD